MSQIKNYALIVEGTPEELVKTVTNAIADGFQPIGGASMMQEAANANKVKAPAGRTLFSQAVVRLYSAEDALGQIVTKVNGRG